MAQASLCAAESVVGLPSPIAYMSTSMATFVGNATNLGKSPSVSYLDISNMTARPPSWSAAAAAAVAAATAESEAGKGPLGLPFSTSSLGASGPYSAATVSQSQTAMPGTGQSSSSSSSLSSSPVGLTEQQSAAQLTLPKNFPNDSMFNAYQPWVIKTYGDLAKTKTITIKKYARILRTLRGEEVNSAENSKFRFWVKSKGFHIGQPEGYDPKPADRIIGRHAVTNPGLDPPLYVPTQPPHNKALNGAEGTVSPGRIYKKVAIVENFFDIIHAVHVDLEGRPGKHAGQKRTYRTITETYAFLPREAVTRFLLGCTECQRRPRTPSPTSLAVAAAPASSSTTATTVASAASSPPPPPTPTAMSPSEPLSPKPATALTSGSVAAAEDSNERPMEASHAPESKSLATDEQQREQQQEQKANCTESPESTSTTTATVSTVTTVSSAATVTTTDTVSSDTKTTNNTSCSNGSSSSSSSSSSNNSVNKNKFRDEKYNPLSITNLLRKDPITRRPPIPVAIVTSSATMSHISEPEPSPSLALPRTSTPTPTPTLTPPPATTTSCVSLDTTKRVSSPMITSVAVPKKMRMLPEDHRIRRSTPSPLAVSRPWSPTVDSKCAPIDYSLPITTSSYLKQQQRLATSESSHKDSNATTAVTTAATTTLTTTTTTIADTTTDSSSESDSEPDDEVSFSPAAGLIDTNLNLLATIQQLHCQVMLALTERLRPPVSSSPVAPVATTTATTFHSNGIGNNS